MKCAEGFDGLIIKQLDTAYFTDVLKVKPEETVDTVVVGAERNLHGAVKTLLLAVPCHERNSWVPIAKVARTSTDWDTVGQHVSLLFRMIAPTIWKNLLVCQIFGLRPRLW